MKSQRTPESVVDEVRSCVRAGIIARSKRANTVGVTREQFPDMPIAADMERALPLAQVLGAQAAKVAGEPELLDRLANPVWCQRQRHRLDISHRAFWGLAATIKKGDWLPNLTAALEADPRDIAWWVVAEALAMRALLNQGIVRGVAKTTPRPITAYKGLFEVAALREEYREPDLYLFARIINGQCDNEAGLRTALELLRRNYATSRGTGGRRTTR